MEYSTFSPPSLHAAPLRHFDLEGIPIVRIDSEAPSNKRKITDKRALAAFLIYMLISLCIVVLAIFYGSALRLNYSVNYHGGICGITAGLRQYRYLYYPLDPSSSSPQLLASNRKCVQSCPTEEDVTNSKIIPILQTQIQRSSHGTSATLLEYTVNSPVYATQPFAGRICIPKDTTLAFGLKREFFYHPLLFYRSCIGSIVNSVFPIFISIMIAILLSGLVSSFGLKRFPRHIVSFATITIVVSLISLGVTFLLVITKPITLDNNVFNTSPFLETIGVFLMGISAISLAIGSLVLVFLRKDALSASSRVLEAVADIVWARGQIGSSAALAAVNYIFGWLWLWILFMLSGTSSSSYKPFPLSSNRNGGVEIVPIERPDMLPVWSIICLFLWVFTGIWVTEFVIALGKFAVAYAGTMWYFTSYTPLTQEGNTIVNTKFLPGCVAMPIGIINHTGSLATAGLNYSVSRLCRIWESWWRPRYIYREQAEIQPRRLRDILTTGEFVEMAVASTGLRTSMRTAAIRSNRVDMVASRLLGAAGLAIDLTTFAIVILSGFYTYFMLSTNKLYSNSTSQYYVSTPLLVTVVEMIFATSVIQPILGTWAVLSDALLYCYLTETTTDTENGLFPSEHPKFRKHAPLPLRDLIAEELQS